MGIIKGTREKMILLLVVRMMKRGRRAVIGWKYVAPKQLRASLEMEMQDTMTSYYQEFVHSWKLQV